MNRYAIKTPLFSLLLVLICCAAACDDCNEDDDPMPVLTSTATASSSVALSTYTDDAGAGGAGGASADAGASTKSSRPYRPSGITACCNALRGNIKNAPDAQKPYYKSAIGICDGVARSGQGRAALSAVRAALRSAKIPNTCM